jgi:acylphosphatase
MNAADGTGAIRRRVTYSGRVQGVGFRFTTVAVSRSYRVVGFVRNMADGTVELEAEGEAGQVDGFLEAIASEMAGNIRDTKVTEQTPLGSESRFEIHY